LSVPVLFRAEERLPRLAGLTNTGAVNHIPVITPLGPSVRGLGSPLRLSRLAALLLLVSAALLLRLRATVGKRAVSLLDDLVDLIRGLQRALNTRLVLQHLRQTLERGSLHHVPRRRVLPRHLERGANASVLRPNGSLRCGRRAFLYAAIVVVERDLSHTGADWVVC